MKYKYEGIGETGAAIIMAGLAANPSTVIFTQGILGKIIFFISKLFCMYLASLGLIMLNVGAANLETIIDGGDYDGSWEKADQIMNQIKERGRELTDDEVKQIDQGVIDAFRKFASFGRVRTGRNSRLQGPHHPSS